MDALIARLSAENETDDWSLKKTVIDDELILFTYSTIFEEPPTEMTMLPEAGAMAPSESDAIPARKAVGRAYLM